MWGNSAAQGSSGKYVPEPLQMEPRMAIAFTIVTLGSSSLNHGIHWNVGKRLGQLRLMTRGNTFLRPLAWCCTSKEGITGCCRV
jgi:hypothetical protein